MSYLLKYELNHLHAKMMMTHFECMICLNPSLRLHLRHASQHGRGMRHDQGQDQDLDRFRVNECKVELDVEVVSVNLLNHCSMPTLHIAVVCSLHDLLHQCTGSVIDRCPLSPIMRLGKSNWKQSGIVIQLSRGRCGGA